jgi:hypothetical protein
MHVILVKLYAHYNNCSTRCSNLLFQRLDMISLSDLPELNEYKNNKKSYVAQNGHIETVIYEL